MPALDGLRGLAVIAVIIYHGDVGFLRGGFIGVDLFFVLSGFLITSLLLTEHRRSGRINLRQFWIRRFRRLLPALMVYLVAVALWAALAADPTTLNEIRQASLAGLGYVANWFFVVSGTSYGAAWSSPSPLLHLWSLAVEEQYYVLWPLIATGLFALVGTRRLSTRRRGPAGRRSARRIFAVVGGSAAAISTAWMIFLAVRGASTDRMYFGTDTRVATILVGVVLAALLEPAVAARKNRPVTTPGRKAALAVALGLAGGVILLAVMLTGSENDPWLFRGGFTLVAVAGAAVIAASVTHPGADRWLGVAPLQWVGTRSYGLYLWHWGLFVAFAVAFPRFTGWSRLAVVAVLTGVVAECSYRFIEQPIRSGRLRLQRPTLMVPGAFVAVAALLVFATIGAEGPPEYLQAQSLDEIEMVAPPMSSTTAPEETEPATTEVPVTVPTEVASETTIATAPAPIPAPPAPPPVVRRPTRVALIGDSVAASLSPALASEFGSKGIAYANGTTPGCGVVEGDIADERGQLFELTASCSGAIANVQRQVIERTRPDLVVVLSSWESGERLTNGVWHPFGSAEADAHLLRLYGEMLDRLTARGARVVLVTVPDPVDSQVRSARAEHLGQLRHMNSVLAQVAARDPDRASLVRLDDIVCPGDPCPRVVDGIELRAKDGTHFDDPPAAALVAGRLVPRLVEVPAGTRR